MKITVLTLIVLSLLTTSAGVLDLADHADVTPSIRFEVLKAVRATGDHQVLVRTNSFDASDAIDYAISTTKTSGEVFAVPPRNKMFVLSLYDSSGSPVPKTTLGAQYSGDLNAEDVLQELKTNNPLLSDLQLANLLPSKLKLKHHPLLEGRPYLSQLPVPEDCFSMTNKGSYFLDMRIRIWTRTTNENCGIVVSEPVRIKIEKQ